MNDDLFYFRDIDRSKMHPGHALRESGIGLRKFCRLGEKEPSVIEILGGHALVEQDGRQYMEPKVAVTLRGKECELYHLLVQKGPWVHPDVAQVLLLFTVYAMRFLAGAQLLFLSLYALSTGHLPFFSGIQQQGAQIIPLILVIAVFGAIVEVTLAVLLYRLIKYVWINLCLHFFLLRHLSGPRIKEILKGISIAEDNNIATAARDTLRVARLYAW